MMGRNIEFRKRVATALLLTVALTITGLAIRPFPAAAVASGKTIAIPRPTPPDDPLDANAAAAFVNKMNDQVKNVLNDFFDIDGVNAKFTEISNKVTERGDMEGKTQKQIVDMYLEDIRASISDAAQITAFEKAFARVMKGDETGPLTELATDPGVTAPKSNPSTAPSSSASLRQYIKSLKYDPRVLLAVQGDGGTMIVDKEKDKKNERRTGNAKIIRCLRTTRNLSKNFDDVAILQPTQGVIYPGALVYADQELVDGKPRPLTGLPRAPIDLRLDLPGLQDEGSFTIANPTDGKVQSAVNKALNFWNNSTSFQDGYVNPSRSNYSSTIAYSSDQLAMSLGFNAKWASGDAAAQFKYSTSNEKNVIVAVYRQVFYTVTFDAPNLPEQFFDPSVSVEEARETFTTEKPSAPGYVSSVNYGRIIMFRMETDKSASAVDAQAAFNYAAGAVTVGGDMKLKYDKILSNSSITVVTMGGNAEVAAETVAARTATDLQKVIKGKNAVYSKNNPGVPIAYTVKFLKDNTIAKMGSTTDFTTEDCKELDNIWIKVIHSGAYIAHFYATWDEPDPNNPDVMVTRTRKEEGKTAGFQIKFDFPGDASNIRVKFENDTGLVWQPRREILNRVLLPVDYNKCYTVTGTTLGSGYDVKQMGEGCP
ncbi:MAG: thiol-activated cytolysin family protein [Acidobacteria bacterium]|nr:thiol-activated cytolysin family protein [Acidobacteriota bacterium]